MHVVSVWLLVLFMFRGAVIGSVHVYECGNNCHACCQSLFVGSVHV